MLAYLRVNIVEDLGMLILEVGIEIKFVSFLYVFIRI